MDMAHTPTPWGQQGCSVYGPPNWKNGTDYGSRLVASVYDGEIDDRPDGEDVANTARIVACVNACAGTSTGELQGPVQVVTKAFLEEARQKDAHQKMEHQYLCNILERIARGTNDPIGKALAQNALQLVGFPTGLK